MLRHCSAFGLDPARPLPLRGDLVSYHDIPFGGTAIPAWWPHLADRIEHKPRQIGRVHVHAEYLVISQILTAAQLAVDQLEVGVPRGLPSLAKIAMLDSR